MALRYGDQIALVSTGADSQGFLASDGLVSNTCSIEPGSKQDPPRDYGRCLYRYT